MLQLVSNGPTCYSYETAIIIIGIIIILLCDYKHAMMKLDTIVNIIFFCAEGVA